jgi:hypothetical protein
MNSAFTQPRVEASEVGVEGSGLQVKNYKQKIKDRELSKLSKI